LFYYLIYLRIDNNEKIDLKKPIKKPKKEFEIEQKEDLKDIDEIDEEEDYSDNELDYHRLYANDDSEAQREKPYLILGDSKGFIKIWDIRGIIKKFGIHEEPEAKIKSDYNIKKKDEINMEIMLTTWLQKIRKFEKFTDIQKHVLVCEWQAHQDAINSITHIKNPNSFISCSKDKKFKVWSFTNGCEMIAEVNINPPINNLEPKSEWKFKIDWEKLKEDEFQKIIKLFKKIGGDTSNRVDNLPDETEHLNAEEANKLILKQKKMQDKQEVINIMKKNKRFKPLVEKKDDEKNLGQGDDGDLKIDVNILIY